MAASATTAGVPPGFRFHPTEEELLLYYLKKKISLDKFELEVIREIDLNKVEPWELQERCRIGSTPQNEWYFFSHKDRKYPTGSRTNRATNAGFWKATGRDKCIRTTYSKIGMRKTLVFYRGRAPHGHKTDWIMHEYRLQDSDDDPPAASAAEDGWVVCRVFKKRCFFKVGGSGGEGSAAVGNHMNAAAAAPPGQMGSSFSSMPHPNLSLHYYHHHHNPNLYYSPYMAAAPASSYPHAAQLQDLLTNVHRPAGGYDFAVLPGDDDVDGGGAMEAAGGGRMHGHPSPSSWAVLDGMDGRAATAAAAAQQMRQMASQRGGGEMDLWGYGK